MALPFRKPKLPGNPSEVLKDRLAEMEQATVSHAQKYLVRRWGNFREVGQRALVWLIVVLVLAIGVIQQTKGLNGFYRVDVPAAGGVYSEGLVGKAENFNPLFISSEAEASIARLIFGSLLKYDADNNLVGDLASNWRVDETGTVYTVSLRPDARWHDGASVQSDDIVYTIHLIQDETTRSPLASSWRGVKVVAVDPTTVQFSLPAPFPPFPYSLTLGIIPKHVLENTPAFQLRTASFNLSPKIGSGPFKFREVRNFADHQEVKLVRNDDYYGGTVNPERFVVYAFENYDDMIGGFNNHEFSAAGGLRAEDLSRLTNQEGVDRFAAPLQHATFAFFKNTQPILRDSAVRQALSIATDKTILSKELDGWAKPINLPILPGQLGYSANLDVATYDVVKAGKLLDQAGWLKAKDGIRVKDGHALELSLVASSNDEYPKIAAELQRQWQALGMTVHTTLVKPSDFQQNVLIPHNYDILLYELAIGQDSDVYAYWHSSQAAEKGLNLAEYRSARVDEALEGGRSRTNAALRSAKYEAFLQQWATDAPAIALYQPFYGYAHRASVQGFAERTLVDPIDRFFNIVDWTAETDQATMTH